MQQIADISALEELKTAQHARTGMTAMSVFNSDVIDNWDKRFLPINSPEAQQRAQES